MYRISYISANLIICKGIIMILHLYLFANCSEYHAQIEALSRDSFLPLCFFQIKQIFI
jgi:hypothetical protein